MPAWQLESYYSDLGDYEVYRYEQLVTQGQRQLKAQRLSSQVSLIIQLTTKLRLFRQLLREGSFRSAWQPEFWSWRRQGQLQQLQGLGCEHGNGEGCPRSHWQIRNIYIGNTLEQAGSSFEKEQHLHFAWRVVPDYSRINCSSYM